MAIISRAARFGLLSSVEKFPSAWQCMQVTPRARL
jgi:hypothetical protein